MCLAHVIGGNIEKEGKALQNGECVSIPERKSRRRIERGTDDQEILVKGSEFLLRTATKEKCIPQTEFHREEGRYDATVSC